jgi:hypothetical protein
MRKRTAAGGILVVAAAVGLWLSGLFKGFGPGGTGDGTGEGDGDGPEAQLVELPTSTDADPADDAPPLAEPGRVVEVLIDGEQYSVRRSIAGGAEWRPADAAEILRLARSASGDSQGVRVRIRRRGTSLPSAEQRLEQALLESGLSSTEVHKVEEIAP